MAKLPEAFTERMQKLLGEEYPAFLESYEQTRRYGLRVNSLKISPEQFEKQSDFHLTPVNFIPGAYCYTEEDGAARHPYYHAGLYYLQEPSAMTPASVLPVRPGDKVLDLCAAPGGKATALGARLAGRGLLVANDISASRCKALLKNIEVFGIPNALVTNEVPAKLAEQFPEFFDAVLVDAPCSGEGMFRKDEATIRAWYPEKPSECAAMQREILRQAVAMLRPGGKLLYSTCTFAPEEDEEMVRFVLDTFPEMHLESIPPREGFAPGLSGLTQCVRLWPHRTGGEGHFLALLMKDGDRVQEEQNTCAKLSDLQEFSERADRLETQDPPAQQYIGQNIRWPNARGEGSRNAGRRGGKTGGDRFRSGRDQRGSGRRGHKGFESVQSVMTEREKAELLQGFLADTGIIIPMSNARVEIRGDMAFVVPEDLPAYLGGITFLRSGLRLGEFRSGRFEPGQALAMAIPADHSPRCRISFTADDMRCLQYLRGETVTLTPEEAEGRTGWQLVCVDGYPLGWAKCAGTVLKNKYLAGWRTKY